MDETKTILKKIYYHDTDSGGVVYYANYLKYFEEGRTELLKDKGIDISKLSKTGIWFVVRHVDIDYKAPANYGDELEITTQIIKTSKISLDFYHEAKKDNKVLVSSNTKLVCINQDFRPTAIPAGLTDKYAQ